MVIKHLELGGCFRVRGQIQVIPSKRLILFEPKVQLLANFLLTGSLAEILPTLDVERGVRYTEVERITGDEPATVNTWLEELASNGVLERRFVSKLVLCPQCNSNDAPVNYCCPTCRSIDIDKKALFEHLACGVVDKEDNFRKKDDLICPRCGRLLGELGITHKEVGTWFQCRSCQKAFDRPQSFHVCKKCRHFFVVEEAIVTDVFAYRLSKIAEAELKSGGIFLKPLKDVLEDSGYEVTVAGSLRGKSGTDHHFDLIGRREKGHTSEVVALDVASSDGLVDATAVTRMFAKRYDTNPDKSILVIIPRINESGKKLAVMYNIALIEAGSAAEAVDKLKRNLTS